MYLVDFMTSLESRSSPTHLLLEMTKEGLAFQYQLMALSRQVRRLQRFASFYIFLHA